MIERIKRSVKENIFVSVEEICIWNNAFTNFQRCWKDYHYRKQCTAIKIKEKLYTTRKKRVNCQGDAENKLNIAVEKLQAHQRPNEFCESNSQISTNFSVSHVKSIPDGNSNLVRKQLPDVTG